MTAHIFFGKTFSPEVHFLRGIFGRFFMLFPPSQKVRNKGASQQPALSSAIFHSGLDYGFHGRIYPRSTYVDHAVIN